MQIFGYTNGSYKKVAEKWSKQMDSVGLSYKIYCIDDESFNYLSGKNIECVKYGNNKTYNGSFTDIGLIRFKIISELLKTHEDVIYSDLDAMWFDNPVPELLSLNFDASVSTVHHKNAYPPIIRKEWGQTLCTGWMHFKDTCLDLIDDFILNYEEFDGNDQSKFNIFIYALNENLNTIPNHSFSLDVEKYNITILGIKKELIHRGNRIDGCKVSHPVC